MMDTSENEITALLEAISQQYGYDFRQYSRAHISRRISNRMSLSGIKSIAELQERILRDPDFYKALREKVIPILKTYAFVRLWHAGCSTGEEVYSMAILLKEEGIYDRTTIYATDFNQVAIDKAREGIYSNKSIKDYTINYQKTGGKEHFSKYYISDYERVIMDQSLKKNIVWANHSLVTDSVFAEMHIILCRNVLIYFNRDLQNKVQQLFFNSLNNGGILCLGSKESLRFTDFENDYAELDKKQRIFKKNYPR